MKIPLVVPSRSRRESRARKILETYARLPAGFQIFGGKDLWNAT